MVVFPRILSAFGAVAPARGVRAMTALSDFPLILHKTVYAYTTRFKPMFKVFNYKNTLVKN